MLVFPHIPFSHPTVLHIPYAQAKPLLDVAAAQDAILPRKAATLISSTPRFTDTVRVSSP